MKIKNILPPGSGPAGNRPKTTDFSRETTVRTLARDPPKGGGPRTKQKMVLSTATLCYAAMLPGRKSAFRAGFWRDCYRESTDIGPPAGRRAHFGAYPVAVPSKSCPEGRFPARRHYCVT